MDSTKCWQPASFCSQSQARQRTENGRGVTCPGNKGGWQSSSFGNEICLVEGSMTTVTAVSLRERWAHPSSTHNSWVGRTEQASLPVGGTTHSWTDGRGKGGPEPGFFSSQVL